MKYIFLSLCLIHQVSSYAQRIYDYQEDSLEFDVLPLPCPETVPRISIKNCELLELERERIECSNQFVIDFIYKNTKYPQEAVEASVEGTVVLQCKIDKAGKLHSFIIVRDLGCGTGEEAMRVFKLLKNFVWKPATSCKVPIDTNYHFPIRFRLED